MQRFPHLSKRMHSKMHTLSTPHSMCLQHSVEQYKAHEVWGKFGTIVPLTEEENSISMLSADETNVIEHIYTIDNKQTNDFQKGVNIIQYKDGTTKKVLMK